MSSGLAIPSSDQIVFALWRRGDLGAAEEYAISALTRDDPSRLQLQEQLAAIRAGHRPPPGAAAGPPPLDLSLVMSLVERNRYYEARCLLYAIGLGGEAFARELAQLLDEVLAPLPRGADPSFGAVLQLIRVGQAPSALRALEEVRREPGLLPDSWERRCRALHALVHGRWNDKPPSVEAYTRDTVVAYLWARDLPGAWQAARAAGAHELANALQRLMDATERALPESSGGDGFEPQTVPMEGHRLCEFQIRMGAFDQADAGYRALLRQDPDDERARGHLADVITVLRALGEEPAPMPSRRMSVDWLRKNEPRMGSGWASGSEKPEFVSFADATDEDDSTGVLEAAREAELLLKLGKAEQALAIYRILVLRYPRHPTYRRRIAEIEALIAQRMASPVAEVTLAHDLSELQRRAVPTRHRLRLPEHTRFADEEDEGPTIVDLGVVPGRDDDSRQ